MASSRIPPCSSPRIGTAGGVAVTLLMLLPAALTGCGQSPASQAFATAESEIEQLATERSKQGPEERLRERGERVFNHYCAICHGKTGAGDGFNAFSLQTPARNLAAEEYQQMTNHERIVTVIADGGTAAGGSVLMPAWKRTLSDQQIEDAAAYVRLLPGIHAAALAEESDDEADDEALSGDDV